jgi:hypothetical protein
MRAKVCVVEVEMVKTVGEVIKDWEFLTGSGPGFVKEPEVDIYGGISGRFNGEVDHLLFDELMADLTSEFNRQDMKYTYLSYLGNGDYHCKFRRNVEESGITVEVDEGKMRKETW